VSNTVKTFRPQDSFVFSVLFIILLIAMAFFPDPNSESGVLGWVLYGVVIGILVGIAFRSAISIHNERQQEKKYTVYLGKPNEPYDWAKEIHDPWKEEHQ